MTTTLQAPRTRRPAPVLWPTLGGEICDWIEAYLVHGPGDVQGTPIVLDDEFRAFIYRCYEVYPRGDPKSGRRRYHRAFLSRPKGRAKSELAGMIACAEALGPSRFDGWSRARPLGRPIVSPIVRCFATEEGQAGNTYDNCYFMLTHGVAADEYGLDDVGLTRINTPGGGSIEAVTSAAKSKDGGKDTFDVFDESHLWTTPELHRLHATVTRNLSKRMMGDGWALETSTMYGLGEGSVAEATHRYALVAGDAGLLFDHRQAPADIDLDDDAAVLAGLRHVYGPAAAWMDLEGLVRREFRDPAKSEADNRRYWLNQPVKLSGRLVDPDKLRALEEPARAAPAGDDGIRWLPERARVVLAFDGSKNRDSTALIGWTVEPKPHLFTVKIWQRPPDAHPDWAVDRWEVDQIVQACFERYQVARMVCDPPGWQTEIGDWAIAHGDETVLAFDTNQPSKMAKACDRFNVATKTGGYSWDGDELLRTHLTNCQRKETRWGPLVVKPDGVSAEKIDAAVAAIIGFEELAHVETPSGPEAHSLAALVEQMRTERASEGLSGAPSGPTVTFHKF